MENFEGNVSNKLIKNHHKNKLSYNLNNSLVKESEDISILKANLMKLTSLKNKLKQKKLQVNAKGIETFKPKLHFSQKNISYATERLKKLKTHDRSKTGLSNLLKDKNLFENIKLKDQSPNGLLGKETQFLKQKLEQIQRKSSFLKHVKNESVIDENLGEAKSTKSNKFTN